MGSEISKASEAQIKQKQISEVGISSRIEKVHRLFRSIKQNLSLIGSQNKFDENLKHSIKVLEFESKLRQDQLNTGEIEESLLLNVFLELSSIINEGSDIFKFYKELNEHLAQPGSRKEFIVSKPIIGSEVIIKWKYRYQRAVLSMSQENYKKRMRRGYAERSVSDIDLSLDSLLYYLQEHHNKLNLFLKLDQFEIKNVLKHYEKFIGGTFKLHEFLGGLLNSKISENDLKNEVWRFLIIFEALRRIKGVSDFNSMANLLHEIDEKFGLASKFEKYQKIESKFEKYQKLESKFEKYQKIESKFDKIYDIMPEFDELHRLSLLFKQHNIEVNPKASHPYVLVNCKQLEFGLSNLLHFSELSEELSKFEEGNSLHKFNLQLDYTSCITESLERMVEVTNRHLSSVRGTVPEEIISSIRDRLYNLEDKFLDFDEFLTEKIFSAIQQVRLISLSQLRLKPPATLVNKEVQVQRSEVKELDLTTFYNLESKRKKQLVKPYYNELLEKRDKQFETTLTLANMATEEVMLISKVDFLEKKNQQLEEELKRFKTRNEYLNQKIGELSNSIDLALIQSRKVGKSNRGFRNCGLEKLEKMLVDMKKFTDGLEESDEVVEGIAENEYTKNQFYQINRFEGEEGYFKSHSRMGYGKNRRCQTLIATSSSISSKIGQKLQKIKDFSQRKKKN